MKIEIGSKASLRKIITTSDVIEFAKISLDTNPLHLDEEFAKNTMFKSRISHGFLVGSLISAVIANKLPGIGSIYLKQDINFKKPVFHGEEVTAEVEVIEEIKPTIYKLSTRCFNNQGEVVIDGYAIVKKG